MPTALICPSCLEVASFVSPAATACPACGTSLSPRLLKAVKRATGARRPLLITIGIVCCCLGVATYAIVPVLVAVLGFEFFAAEGEEINREEILSEGLLFAFAGAFMSAIAWGFWKEHPVTRHLAVSYFVVVSAIKNPLSENMLYALVLTAFPAWYFYFKPNVVAYYEELKRPGRLPIADN